jgi:S1-C subfamily serine protease
MKRILSLTAVVVIAALLLSACSPAGITIDLPFLNRKPASEGVQTAPSPTPPAQVVAAPPSAPVVVSGEGLAALQGTLTQIYESVTPSVVSIQVAAQVSSTIPFPFTIPGQDSNQQPPVQRALGSGFVWEKSGHIVTNNHVVEGADQITVVFSDGYTAEATLVGSDPDSDLAVIKVDVNPDRLHPVSLADSDQVKVGQLAIAIGSPYGLEQTMTLGIISALGRSLPVQNTQTPSGLTYSIPDVIQTDAPINPGNSGGVLLNDQGQVVGVTTAIESNDGSNAGIGFVIPSNIVKRVVPALIVDGSYEHPYLGISGTSLTSALAAEMDLPEETRGALVLTVTAGSPADKAGLRGGDRVINLNGRDIEIGGDVITQINDQPVKGMDDLVSYLATEAEVGQKVTLKILRDGKEQTLEATLASRPSAGDETSRAAARGGSLGITARALTPEIASEMNLPRSTHGVLVVRVLAGSAADEAGLRGGTKTAVINGEEVRIGGDVITAVEGQSVTTVQELRDALANYDAGERVTLTIIREGETIELEVILGALQ